MHSGLSVLATPTQWCD